MTLFKNEAGPHTYCHLLPNFLKEGEDSSGKLSFLCRSTSFLTFFLCGIVIGVSEDEVRTFFSIQGHYDRVRVT